VQTEDITTEVACVVEIRGNGEIGVDKCEKIMNEIEIKIFDKLLKWQKLKIL